MPAEVVVVLGAVGGVGASTVAALLAARRAADGRRRVALVDLHGTGGGLEVLLGTEEEPGARWPDLDQVRGALEVDDLVGVLPLWRGVEVLGADRRGGPPAAEAVAPVWRALRSGCDTVVVDLPVGGALAGVADPSSDEVVAQVLDARTDLLVVTGQDVVGVAGALRACSTIGSGRAQLVLRGRRRARVAPLEAAKVLDLPLLAVVPTDRSMGEAVDRGLGPVVGRLSGMGRSVERLARGAGRG